MNKFLSLLLCFCCLGATEAFACHPLVQCSSVKSDGSITATFSFVGGENTIALGAKNSFSPAPIDRGQGTHFNTLKNGQYVFGSDSAVAGQTTLVVSVAAGSTVSWALNGTIASCTAPSPTPTATPTKSPTPSPTCSPTPTRTPTSTPTSTPTASPTSTPTKSPTPSPTCSPVPTKTPTPTPTKSPTPSPTQTPSPTCTPVPPTPTPTPVPECPGSQVKDQCGKCGGDNSSCKDCAGVIHGAHVIDDCGACNLVDSPDFNKTCLGCDHVPNSHKIVDQCGICGGDDSVCKGCDGVPNSGLTVDACGVCGGQNAVCVIGCDGVANSGKTIDECGVCGGDGSSCHCPLHKVKIDKSNLIKKAKILYSDKAVKYFNGAVKCNKDLKKWSAREIQKDLAVLQEFISLVNSIPNQVEVCPGQCVKVVLSKTLVQLRRLNKKLYKYASDAQHGARNACHATGPGNGATGKLSSSLDTDIKKCHDKDTICL